MYLVASFISNIIKKFKSAGWLLSLLLGSIITPLYHIQMYNSALPLYERTYVQRCYRNTSLKCLKKFLFFSGNIPSAL